MNRENEKKSKMVQWEPAAPKALLAHENTAGMVQE